MAEVTTTGAYIKSASFRTTSGCIAFTGNFDNPINVTLPNVTVFQPQNDQNLSDAFRTLGMQTIHLTTAINQSLERKIIF
jgi:hypothetical protein